MKTEIILNYFKKFLQILHCCGIISITTNNITSNTSFLKIKVKSA